jgi:CRP-like cAMP-binding protein
MQQKGDYMNIKIKSKLFENLTEGEISSVLKCLNAKIKEYKKNSFVWHAGDKPKYMGIVIQGQVNIIKEDILGNKTLIANIEKNHIFGESFAIADISYYPVSVFVPKDSKILLLDFDGLKSTCKNNCDFHNQIIENLLKLTARKNIMLNQRINCITKKSTKQKLAFYLVSELGFDDKLEIKIPFNREELANYLGVNRSALSRELSSMKKNHIIDFNKNNFKLLDVDKLNDILNQE